MATVVDTAPQEIAYPEQLNATKLRDTLRMHRDGLRPHRENRIKFLREFVGTQYADGGSDKPVPINYIEMLSGILARTMVFNNPRVSITTMQRQVRNVAKMLSLSADNRVRQMDIKEVLQDIVLDGIFLMGIAKVGSELGPEVRINGMPYQVAEPWIDIVDIHDFVIDLNCRRWKDAAFVGNRYTTPLHVLADDPSMDQNVVNSMAAKEYESWTEDGEDLPNTLGVGDEGSPREPFLKMVDCWDVWLPYHGQVVTIPDTGTGFLRQISWDGPSDGPYLPLKYQKVPGNLMPLSPMASIYDLHEMINILYRKMTDQAERQKTIGIFRDEKEGERIRDASDGDIVTSPDPAGGREARYGGVDPGTLSFAMHGDERISRQAGNLNLMGGFAAESKTLGQDTMLAQTASQKLDHMQDKTEGFTAQAIRSLMWYDMRNPILSVPVEMVFPGTTLRVPIDVSPAKHFEKFFDLNFNVVPFSMQSKSPAQMANELIEVTTGVLIPAQQFMAAQNIGINWSQLIEKIGELKQMPHLQEVIIDMSGQGDMINDVARSDRPPGPAVTHRVNTRVNKSGEKPANDMKSLEAMTKSMGGQT